MGNSNRCCFVQSIQVLLFCVECCHQVSTCSLISGVAMPEVCAAKSAAHPALPVVPCAVLLHTMALICRCALRLGVMMRDHRRCYHMRCYHVRCYHMRASSASSCVFDKGLTCCSCLAEAAPVLLYGLQAQQMPADDACTSICDFFAGAAGASTAAAATCQTQPPAAVVSVLRIVMQVFGGVQLASGGVSCCGLLRYRQASSTQPLFNRRDGSCNGKGVVAAEQTSVTFGLHCCWGWEKRCTS